MKIRAFLERENREKVIKIGSGKVGNLLERLGINPESVIIARGGSLVTEEHKLTGGDKFRIIHIKASD